MKNSDKPIYPLQDLGFPSDPSVIKEDALFGLTKREYFAAMRKEPMFGEETLSLNWAKEIMASSPPTDALENIKWWISAHEKFSLMRADALLNELEK